MSRRRIRSIATVMLWVWLLSLGVGAANACVLTDREPARHAMRPQVVAVGGQGHAARHAAVQVPGVIDHAACQEQHDGADPQACRHWCELDQTALIKSKAETAKLQPVEQASKAIAQALPNAAAEPWSWTTSPALLAPTEAHAALRRAGPALPIMLQRLTT